MKLFANLGQIYKIDSARKKLRLDSQNRGSGKEVVMVRLLDLPPWSPLGQMH